MQHVDSILGLFYSSPKRLETTETGFRYAHNPLINQNGNIRKQFIQYLLMPDLLHIVLNIVFKGSKGVGLRFHGESILTKRITLPDFTVSSISVSSTTQE